MTTKRKPTFRWANQKISTGSKGSDNQPIKQTFCEYEEKGGKIL